MLITLCNYSPVIIVCSKLSRFSDRNKLLMLLLRCVCAKCFFSFFLSLSLSLSLFLSFSLLLSSFLLRESPIQPVALFLSFHSSLLSCPLFFQLFGCSYLKSTSYVLLFFILRSSRSRARIPRILIHVSISLPTRFVRSMVH